jgi:hypothetical protein
VNFPFLNRVPAFIAALVLLFLAPRLHAQSPEPPPRLSALATEPDWSALDQFQGTITRADFIQLLDQVYAPANAWKSVIDIQPDGAHILTTGTARMLLRFADDAAASPKAPPRYWHPIAGARQGRGPRPLAGITIALDPGHLGGQWAKMEERWFQLSPGSKPVAEGDMTLLTARLLATRLQAAGANVEFVRNATQPTTKLRPLDLLVQAREQLKHQGLAIIRDTYAGPADPLKMNSVQWTSELLFYRVAEIQARARLVNTKLQPDLVLCLHYNAEAWGDPANPQLVEKNHMHVMVNGTYSPQELSLDDVRWAMLIKLLTHCYSQEVPIAQHIATSLSAATGLPPYQYTTGNATRVGDNPYVWSRNLLANRLYQCPVVYIEPYVMNSPEVWDRVQAGDYDGRKLVHGKFRESIYREYARAVATGIIAAVARRTWLPYPHTNKSQNTDPPHPPDPAQYTPSHSTPGQSPP